MAGATGLEPATYGSTGRHSNQLSYAPENASFAKSNHGGLPDRLAPRPRREVGRRGLWHSAPPPIGGVAPQAATLTN